MKIEFNLDFTKCSSFKTCESLIKAGLLGDPIFLRDDSEKYGNAICVIPKTEDELISRLKKTHKGNVLREIKKADKAGFFCEWFNYFNHIDEIVHINRSKNIRGGKKLSNFYLADRSEFGPTLNEPILFEDELCDYHQIMYWGVFEPITPDNRISNTANKELIGYIRVFRLNDVAWYNMIMGHGGYLKYGVMHKMHIDLLKHYLNSTNPPKYITYGPGNVETNTWKRKALFQNSEVTFKTLDSYYKKFEESSRKQLKADITNLIKLGKYTRAEILIRTLRFYPRISRISRLVLQIKRLLKNNVQE